MSDPRGDVSVIIDGTEHTMRLTFAAALKIEKRIGCGLLKLANRMAQMEVTTEEVATVIHAGVTAAGGKLTFDQVGEAVMAAGLIDMAKPATELVLAALMAGKRPPEGDAEKKAAE
ncbi:MAG: gene transfer agent family protein [Burkholderiaceae bacterium]|nr:gene transfer agent family protein [Burkholderiaceae bacterium]